MRLWIAVLLLVGCKSVETHQGDDAAVDTVAIDAQRVGDVDFVINSTYAGTQYLSNDYEANGLQLAAITDSMWIAVFRDDCTDCDLFGRRFDVAGMPAAADFADANQFPINQSHATMGSIPAVAGSSTASSPAGTEHVSLVLWDFIDTANSTQGIACRSFGDQGVALSSQLAIANESADVVSVTPSGNGNFIATWQSFVTTTAVIRSIIVRRDCTTLTAFPISISDASSTSAGRAHAASNGVVSLYTWVNDGAVHVRVANLTGVPSSADILLLPKTAMEEIDHVRVAPWGSSFAVAVRWANSSGIGPGKIEVYRVAGNGALAGGPYLVTERSGSDFASDKSFGIASRYDGLVLVAWHACETGPGTCDVYGRLLDTSGTVGGEVQLATTTAADQTNPSVTVVGNVFVAAWNDTSGVGPDSSGGAVRGRIIRPDLFGL